MIWNMISQYAFVGPNCFKKIEPTVVLPYIVALSQKGHECKMRCMQGHWSLCLVSAIYIGQVTRPSRVSRTRPGINLVLLVRSQQGQAIQWEKKTVENAISVHSLIGPGLSSTSAQTHTPRHCLFELPFDACYRETCRKATR